MNFWQKYEQAIAITQSLLYLSLDPQGEGHSPDETSLQQLITLTKDLVSAYKVNLGYYQILGSSGIALLQTTLRAIPAEIPVILDAQYSNLETSTGFARLVFETWQAEACTVLPYAGLDQVAPFLMYPDRLIFVLCYTGNPSGSVVQDYPPGGKPLYLHLVEACQSWGTTDQVGLYLGEVMPDVLAEIRKAAPKRLILLTDYDSVFPDLTEVLDGGLNESGEGLLLPIPPGVWEQEAPREAIARLRDQINQERSRKLEGRPTCELWISNVCFLEPTPYRDLILQLYDIGCITFGDHVQASGEILPYYIDLRKIISLPQIFHQIVSAYADILKTLEFDRIAGIPYGSLPTATGLALRLNYPMIYPRKEIKTYGAKRLVEGHFEPGEKIVIVEDILITGRSAIEGAAKLKSVGLQVEDIVVLIDHERGVKEKLKAQGYQGYSVFTLSEIAETLQQAGRISLEQFELFGITSTTGSHG